MLGTIFILNGRLSNAEKINAEIIENINMSCDIIDKMLEDLPEDKKAKYLDCRKDESKNK